MLDLEVLERLHALLRPRSYLQFGLKRPELMALAKCGAIGVASTPRVTVSRSRTLRSRHQ
jgi:hypothetical protein